MHQRRLAAFLIGGWLLGSFFMFFVATQNFKGVERLLDMPTASANERLEVLGKGEARLLLRYQASELNRFFFMSWERLQLIWGAALVLVALRGSQRIPILALPVLMLLLVAVEHWLLTPEINRLGMQMDFVQNARETPTGQSFWRYHQAYSYMEVSKLVLGIAFAWTVLARRRVRGFFRRQPKAEVNVVHDA